MMRQLVVILVAIATTLAVAGDTHAIGTDRKPPVRKYTKGEARQDRWPKPIDEFLAGEFLERSDVVLTRREYDPTSFMIRWATGSPFSHAALIFTSPNVEPGVSSTFVIEAGTGGVDLTNLRDYVYDKSSFVAIKRLKKPWFDAEKQSRVRGLLLDNIKSEYNYWAIVRFARSLWFGIKRSVSGKKDAVLAFQKSDWQRPNEFICSGLVQFGFVEAVVEYVRNRKLPPWTVADVMFTKEGEAGLIPRETWEQMSPEEVEQMLDDHTAAIRESLASQLEAITPHDIAVSDKLEWLYFIKDGLVYRVNSLADVERRAR